MRLSSFLQRALARLAGVIPTRVVFENHTRFEIKGRFRFEGSVLYCTLEEPDQDEAERIQQARIQQALNGGVDDGA